MTGSRTPYDALTGCLTASENRHACTCTKPAAWYANGNKVFALVTYAATLVWVTLALMGLVTGWAWLAVGLAWLVALVFAYGGDGR